MEECQMNIQKLVGFNGMVFLKEEEVFGSLAGVNFLDETIVVAVDLENGEKHILEGVKLEDVELLTYLCDFDGEPIIDRDVLFIADKLYEIELLEGDKVTLHLLDEELERKLTGWAIPVSKLAEELGRIQENKEIELVANLFEIGGVEVVDEEEAEEDKLDFNIKIGKKLADGHIQYLYVCNNKIKEEIDLINVVFVGADLIEEEAYERETVSYEEYLERLESGKLIEVGQAELRNYALGVLHGKQAEMDLDDYNCGEHCGCHDEDEDEEFCACGEYIEDCTCD